MIFICKVQSPVILLLTTVLILAACDYNESETTVAETEFIIVRNVNNSIADCNELIDDYKEEIEKQENAFTEPDSGMTEIDKLTKIGELHKKLTSKIADLENMSSTFTAEQLYKFKVMRQRFYFHEMEAPL